MSSGKIVQIIGAVIDVEFPRDQIPKVYDALKLDDVDLTLEVQQQLNRMGSMMPVIFITGHGDVPMAVQAMKEGAFEFIQKPFRDQDLLDRINHALKQDAENRSTVARRAEVQHRLETLTPRERQVMEMVVDGAANKVIAIDLNLSERTVEIHRAKVMEKMGARSVAHLVKLQLTLTDNAQP